MRALIRIMSAALAFLCPAVVIHSTVRARADWLRRNPTLQDVDHAIRLDPQNSYAWTLLAEFRERESRFSDAEFAWGEALQRDHRNVEAWTRWALLAENRGAIQDAERRLLKAAALSQTWLPRWSLANFYARRNQVESALRWSRLALERASEQSYALHPLLDDLAPRDYVLDHVVPANRPVLRSYIDYLSRSDRPSGIGKAALKLADLIPATSADWPGTEVWRRTDRSQPAEERERHVLLLAVTRLLEYGAAPEATELWNRLVDRGILRASRWDASTPVINPDFRGVPYEMGLDWVSRQVSGIAVERQAEYGELIVRLNGRQSENARLMQQRIFIPTSGLWDLEAESRTSGLNGGNGLAWRLSDLSGREVASLDVPPSKDWVRSVRSLPLQMDPGILRLTLAWSRVPGFVRAQGSANFRSISLRKRP